MGECIQWLTDTRHIDRQMTSSQLECSAKKEFPATLKKCQKLTNATRMSTESASFNILTFMYNKLGYPSCHEMTFM